VSWLTWYACSAVFIWSHSEAYAGAVIGAQRAERDSQVKGFGELAHLVRMQRGVHLVAQ
jgi:hypothetical protein